MKGNHNEMNCQVTEGIPSSKGSNKQVERKNFCFPLKIQLFTSVTKCKQQLTVFRRMQLSEISLKCQKIEPGVKASHVVNFLTNEWQGNFQQTGNSPTSHPLQ